MGSNPILDSHILIFVLPTLKSEVVYCFCWLQAKAMSISDEQSDDVASRFRGCRQTVNKTSRLSELANMRETDNMTLYSKITDDKCLAYTKTRSLWWGCNAALLLLVLSPSDQIHSLQSSDAQKNTSFIGVTLHLASDCHNLGTLAPTKSMSVQFLWFSLYLNLSIS